MSPSTPNSRRLLAASAIASIFLACAKVIDLQPVPFSESGATNDAAGADSGIVVDDSDFCRSKPDVVYCRQFDDGTDVERGAAIVVTSGGRIAIDETDPAPPLSPPATLHFITTEPSVNGSANASFGVRLPSESILQSVKFEFSAKITGGNSVPTIAMFAYGSCRYLLDADAVERATLHEDGGLSQDTQYAITPVLPRGKWFSIEFSVERTADNRAALALVVDGTPRVRVYEAEGCTITPGATWVNMGTLWGQPFELRIDDLRIGPI